MGADHELVRKCARSGIFGAFRREHFEDAMMDYAKQLALPGETEERAFVRLAKAHDEEIIALYEAALSVEPILPEPLRKREVVEAEMESHARLHQRPGETEEQAYSRLLDEDERMRRLYEELQ